MPVAQDVNENTRTTRMNRPFKITMSGVAVVLSVIVLVGGFLAWFMRERVTDATSAILHDLERDYVLTRSMFIAEHDGGRHYLETGAGQDGYPRSLAEYRAKGKWTVVLLDELPAGTSFRVHRCRRTDSPWDPTTYWLSVEITSGKYYGRTFTMPAGQIMHEDKAGNELWFLPFVRAAS